jgi:hypothetical protein
MRPGILNRNGAMNAVPLADEDQRELFADKSGPIAVDRDGVFEIGDAPVAGLGGGSERESEKKCNWQE